MLDGSCGDAYDKFIKITYSNGVDVAVMNMTQAERRSRILQFRRARGGVAMALTHQDVVNILNIIAQSASGALQSGENAAALR